MPFQKEVILIRISNHDSYMDFRISAVWAIGPKADKVPIPYVHQCQTRQRHLVDLENVYLGAAAPEGMVASSRFPDILDDHDSEGTSR